MTDSTFAKAVEKKTAKDFQTIHIADNAYYSHPTFSVNNLADFIRLVTVISSINKESSYSETVVYRGMSDQEYDLRPGLARYTNQDPAVESVLINDFLTRRPDAFNGLSEFDTLAKMQHYGLPTRLLDFTLNPLVALYFASESKGTKDGRILCHSTELQNDSSPFVNAICKAAIKKTIDENYTIDEYLCDESLPLKKYMTEAYILEPTTVVRPKYWNQRIANQAGVFMVFPNNLLDRYMGILIHEKELGMEKAIKEFGRGPIPEARIQEALELEPVDDYRREDVRIVTDDSFQILARSYRGANNEIDFWEIIKDRFKISGSIKKLCKRKINNNFCSIIIEGKSKKKILKELSYIGIGADHIYPELEYTAQEIKRRLD